MGDIKKLDVAGFLSRVESISPGYIDSLWDRYAEADQFLVEAEQIVATCGIPGIVAPGYVSKIARIETMRKNFALLLEYPYKLVEEVHEIDWKFAKRIDEIWNSYATVKIDDINLKNNLNTDLSDFFVTLKDKGSDKTRLRNKFYLESVNNPKDKVSLVDIYEKHKDELDAIYYGTIKSEKDLVGESIKARENAIRRAYKLDEPRREQLYRSLEIKKSHKLTVLRNSQLSRNKEIADAAEKIQEHNGNWVDKLAYLEKRKVGEIPPDNVIDAQNKLDKLTESQIASLAQYANPTPGQEAYTYTRSGGKMLIDNRTNYERRAHISIEQSTLSRIKEKAQSELLKSGLSESQIKELANVYDVVRDFEKRKANGDYGFLSPAEEIEYSRAKINLLSQEERAVLERIQSDQRANNLAKNEYINESIGVSVKETQLPEKYQNDPRIVDVKVPNYKEGTIDENKEILRSVYGWSDEKIKEYTGYSNTIASAEAMFDYLERFDIDPENVGAKGITNTLMSLRPRNVILGGVVALASHFEDRPEGFGDNIYSPYNVLVISKDYMRSEVVNDAITDEHPIAQKVYTVSTSAVDTAENVGVGVALSAAGAPALAVQATSLTLMGSNAAADTYINARNRGATAKEAKENAIATFAIEVGTEVIPLDYLWKATKGIKYTTKPLVNVSIGAALEGTENVVSDLANRGVEDIIYGKSGYSEKNYLTELYQKELIAQGYSSEDAYKWAVQKEQLSFGKDVIKDGISGAVSGFVLNGIASGLASRGNVAAGSLEGDSKGGNSSGSISLINTEKTGSGLELTSKQAEVNQIFRGDQFSEKNTFDNLVEAINKKELIRTNNSTTCKFNENLKGTIPDNSTYMMSVSTKEMNKLCELRNSVPKVNEDTVMQKVITPEQFTDYTKNITPRTDVSGCASRASDVAPYTKNMKQAYETLRLDYEGTIYKEMVENNGDMFVMRFTSDYCPQNTEFPKMDGSQPWNKPPCTGTGFVGTKEHLVPEYSYGIGQQISDGAIYKIDASGKEVMVAFWNHGQFVLTK